MHFETAEYETRGKVGYIIMNRPQKRNALDYQLVDDLDRAFDAAEADDSVSVVVLKGNGPRVRENGRESSREEDFDTRWRRS